jgi:hypothetical protein
MVTFASRPSADENTVLPALAVAKSKSVLGLLPSMANCHGLIAGATGTGKTVTLQGLAERFSAIGVPVFMADVEKLKARTATTKAVDGTPAAGGLGGILEIGFPGGTGPKGRTRESPFEAATKSAARAIGSEMGRRIIRGVLGSILGAKR